MGDWKIKDREQGDLFAFDTATYTVVNKRTGETKEVVVWDGDEDYELQQVGDKIGDGNFYDDDDD